MGLKGSKNGPKFQASNNHNIWYTGLNTGSLEEVSEFLEI